MSRIPDPDALLIDKVFDPAASYICDRIGGSCLDLCIKASRAGMVTSAVSIAVLMAWSFSEQWDLLTFGGITYFMFAVLIDHKDIIIEVKPWANRARNNEIFYAMPPFRLNYRFARFSRMILFVVVLALFVKYEIYILKTSFKSTFFILVTASLGLEVISRYLASCRVRPPSRSAKKARAMHAVPAKA